MRGHRLSTHLCSAPIDLDEGFLRELNAFRLSVMRLKPTTDPDADFAEVVRACRSSEHVAWLRDGAGVLCASFILSTLRGEASGRRHKTYTLNYAFARPDVRGHPAYLWLGLRVMLLELARWRGEALWVGGVGYPASVLALDRAFGPLSLGGDEVPEHVRPLLDRAIAEEAGNRWEPAAARMNMPTIPPVMSDGWYARAEGDPLYRRYVARCPDWTEGYALACLGRLRPARAIAAVMGRALQRRMRQG